MFFSFCHFLCCVTWSSICPPLTLIHFTFRASEMCVCVCVCVDSEPGRLCFSLCLHLLAAVTQTVLSPVKRFLFLGCYLMLFLLLFHFYFCWIKHFFSYQLDLIMFSCTKLWSWSTTSLYNKWPCENSQFYVKGWWNRFQRFYGNMSLNRKVQHCANIS